MNAPRRWILASANPGKLRELRELLDPAGFAVQSLAQAGLAAPEEPHFTFVENALVKARHAAEATGLPAIADDSGLLVNALDDAPGVRSARYAGEHATDDENLRHLLAAMEGVPVQARAARFVCVMVAVRFAQDPDPWVARGVWHGRITTEPRGQGGFGYDPVFELPELGLCSAELAPQQKHALSHRGQACRELLRLLGEAD